MNIREEGGEQLYNHERGASSVPGPRTWDLRWMVCREGNGRNCITMHRYVEGIFVLPSAHFV